MIYREPNEVVDILCEIYDEKFGGEKRGRYRIMRVDLRKLAGRRRLHPSIVDEIMNLMIEKNYLMEEVADYFIVIDVNVLEGYRKVPRSSLEPYWEEGDEDEVDVTDDDDEDDD